MKWFNTPPFLQVPLFTFLLLLLTISQPVQATGNLTDAAFFGVWNGTAWTTVGKLNYAYNGGVLAAVEAKVKANDYAGAKDELLLYFKNRSTRTVPPVGRNTTVANLTSNLTFYGPAADTLVGEIAVTGTSFSTVSLNVLGSVQGTAGKTNTVGYLLMGKIKEMSIAEFYSKENADIIHRPQLEVVVAGTTYTLTASKDSYVVGDSVANYGSSTSLYVRETGTPYNNEAGRTYIVFDLSSLPQNLTPTAATLKLYGRNMSVAGTKNLYVFHTGTTNFNEATINWRNTLGQIYSWQGAPGGTDWNSPHYSDAEWSGVQTRFYFAPALAGELNADPTDTFYSGNLINLMLDFATDKPAYYDLTHDSKINTAIRLGNWITGYHYVRKSNALTASANTEILKCIWQKMSYLSDTTNFTLLGNFGVIESSNLYTAAAYFPELTPAWQTLAETRLLYMLSSAVFPDFSYGEATTGYASVLLNLYGQVILFAQANGLALNPLLEDKLLHFVHFVAYSTAPDGSDVVYGDGDPMNNNFLIKAYGDAYNDPALQYLGSGGTEGSPDPVTSILYPVGKIATMRSGWETNALFMHFNNGQATSHAHKDLLNTVLYAYDKQLLINPGRYNYTYSDPITQWLRETTEAKNCVEIDDLPMNQGASMKVFNNWKTNKAFDFAEASHNGYSGFTAVRSILFIKPHYWIVSDTEIPESTAVNHNYDQLWHFLPNANLSLQSGTKKTSTAFSLGANLQVIPADPDSITATLRNGYYSNVYGSVTSAKYIAYEKNSKKGTVTFDAVLYPTVGGDTREITVSRLPLTPAATPAIATALKITIPGVELGSLIAYAPFMALPMVLPGDTGYYYLSKETAPFTARSFDVYNYDGKMAYIQTSNAGALQEADMIQGKNLKQNSTNLISAPLPIQSISVKWDGATLIINSPELKASTSTTSGIAIYAPSATTVTLNGVSIPYTRVGNNVYAVESQATTEPAYVELPRATMTASSVYGSEVANKAKDNNVATSWYSAVMTAPTGFQYLYTDLGATYNVKQVKLIPRFVGAQSWHFPVDFTLQASIDSITWDTVPGHFYNGYPRPVNPGGEYFVFTAPVAARYIGVGGTRFMVDPLGNYFMQMAELYPYKQANQASRALVTSSSTLAGYPVANISDNNSATFWGSALQTSSTGSEWVTVDMGGSYSVNSITLVPTLLSGVVTCFPVDFKIQQSTDGTTWTDVPGQSYTSYITPASGSGEVFNFGSSVSTRFIRILATRFSPQSPGNYYFSIAEINIF